MSLIRKIVRGFLQCVLILLITVGGLEVLLRVFENKLPPAKFYQYQSEKWIRYDRPDVEVWHYPNVQATHEKSCFRVTYTSNQFGMRDRDRSLEKTKFRVAVLGDSFTEGYGVGDNQTFPSLLENQIFKGQPIEFLNFGTAGNFGTIQEWLLYKNLVRKFSPDLVILAFLNYNDITDNSWWYWQEDDHYRRRPYFKEENSQIELFYPDLHQNQKSYNPYQASNQFHLWMNKHLYVYRYINEIRREQKIKKQYQVGERLATRVYDQHPSEKWEEGWFFTEEAMKRLAEEVHRDHAQLLIVNLVDPQQIDPEVIQSLGGDQNILTPNHRLQQIAEKLQLSYFSLYPGFIDFQNQQNLQPPYFSTPCDHHWGPLGHQVAAQLIGDYLEKAGMIGKTKITSH